MAPTLILTEVAHVASDDWIAFGIPNWKRLRKVKNLRRCPRGTRHLVRQARAGVLSMFSTSRMDGDFWDEYTRRFKEVWGASALTRCQLVAQSAINTATKSNIDAGVEEACRRYGLTPPLLYKNEVLDVFEQSPEEVTDAK